MMNDCWQFEVPMALLQSVLIFYFAPAPFQGCFSYELSNEMCSFFMELPTDPTMKFSVVSEFREILGS